MKQAFPFRALALLAALAATPLHAVPGGDIGTMQNGRYICELTGSALGQSGYHQPERDFSLINASSYRTAEGTGSYLLIGDRLTMTSGPRKGDKYRFVSKSFLRLLDAEGNDSALRCIRRGGNNT